MNRLAIGELLVQGHELKLTDNDVSQVVGCIKDTLPVPATVVLLLIQPNQCSAVKLVDLEIPEKGEKMRNTSFSTEEGENVFCTQITIKIIREYNDGMISGDVLTF
jgi:hypothetical protein